MSNYKGDLMFKTSILITTLFFSSLGLANDCKKDAEKLCVGIPKSGLATCIMKNRNSLSDECKKQVFGGQAGVDKMNENQKKIDADKVIMNEQIKKIKESQAENAKNAELRNAKEKNDPVRKQINAAIEKSREERATRDKQRTECRETKKQLCGTIKKYKEQKACWLEKATPECAKLVPY